MRTSGLSCCGGTELIGINDYGWSPAGFVKSYGSYTGLLEGLGKGYCTITYAYDVKKKGGPHVGRSKAQCDARIAAFRAYLSRNGLGTLTVIRKAPYNPNYGKKTKLKNMVWIPDNKAILALAKKNGWIKRSPYGGKMWA